jgi:hypothetical protein
MDAPGQDCAGENAIGEGVYKQQRPPRRMAVSYYLLSELMPRDRLRWLTSGSG